MLTISDRYCSWSEMPSVLQSSQKVKRSFYFMPKRLLDSGPNDVGVVGGTFIEGATPETPNYEEFDVMMAGARNFYGI